MYLFEFICNFDIFVMTYFFDNGNVLLEDKDQRGTITARIILRMQTLLDWITLIDREQRYYVLHEMEK